MSIGMDPRLTEDEIDLLVLFVRETPDAPTPFAAIGLRASVDGVTARRSGRGPSFRTPTFRDLLCTSPLMTWSRTFFGTDANDAAAPVTLDPTVVRLSMTLSSALLPVSSSDRFLLLAPMSSLLRLVCDPACSLRTSLTYCVPRRLAISNRWCELEMELRVLAESSCRSNTSRAIKSTGMWSFTLSITLSTLTPKITSPLLCRWIPKFSSCTTPGSSGRYTFDSKFAIVDRT